YLAKVIPETVLAQPLSLLLGSALTTLAVLLVMGLVMAALLHRTVAAPIGALQRRIGAVSRGDFSQDPSIEWDHELGDVGRGINGLSRSVSSLMEKRIEDEKQRLELEYRMLQNQISPHFIYNTLNSIKWMATIQHAPGVAEMVTALSRLLKSVSKGAQRLVPLEEEFRLLEDYFTIQRYRYGGTITMELRPPEDEALLKTCLVPRFSLQPLVENAIFHGIEPNGGVGRVEITVERPGGGDVLIWLSDDGVGMAQEQIDRILTGPQAGEEEKAAFRHIGVWNVHRLLQLSFGPDYGLLIDSEPGVGTEITLRLPGSRQTAGPAAAPKGQ
ncbi:MAG: sensor histidine kinase, partial [Oscillospiraceae bacterium]|nr:sensor histidine kinase [Oscillospiraceae bacterium]